MAVDQLYADALREIDALRALLAAAEADRDAMRPVVEAAEAFRGGFAPDFVEFYTRSAEHVLTCALIAAVDTYRAATPATPEVKVRVMPGMPEDTIAVVTPEAVQAVAKGEKPPPGSIAVTRIDRAATPSTPEGP